MNETRAFERSHSVATCAASASSRRKPKRSACSTDVYVFSASRTHSCVTSLRVERTLSLRSTSELAFTAASTCATSARARMCAKKPPTLHPSRASSCSSSSASTTASISASCVLPRAPRRGVVAAPMASSWLSCAASLLDATNTSETWNFPLPFQQSSRERQPAG